MSNILLVEDDKTIRITVEFALTKAGYTVSSADNGADAIEIARSTAPDLVLLDIMLPKVSGIDVARTLRAEGMRAPIIMLTALDREQDKIAGLDAGADDYITKPFSTNELLARIRANVRRSEATQTKQVGVIKVGQLVIDIDNAVVTSADEQVTLRTKEFLLLKAMACSPGALMTRERLSKEVWGEDFISTSRTIDTHVRRVRKAIDKGGWTYIQTVHGMGYRFEPVSDAQ